MWALVVGDNGLILKTNDGGASFYIRSITSTSNLTAIHMIDANDGYCGQ